MKARISGLKDFFVQEETFMSFLARRSRTYALRIMFRDLAQSGCVACMSRRSALDRCFHDPLHPCWPASAHTAAALFTMINRCLF